MKSILTNLFKIRSRTWRFYTLGFKAKTTSRAWNKTSTSFGIVLFYIKGIIKFLITGILVLIRRWPNFTFTMYNESLYFWYKYFLFSFFSRCYKKHFSFSRNLSWSSRFVSTRFYFFNHFWKACFGHSRLRSRKSLTSLWLIKSSFFCLAKWRFYFYL